MGVFDAKPLNTTSLNNRLRKNPLLFGAPFLMIMVVASYALVPFAQTKYELQDRKVSNVSLLPPPNPRVPTQRVTFQVTREQELGLENRKRKFDIREEYFASVSSSASILPIYLLSTETQRTSRRRLGAQTH
jgi:cytochrome c oxidase assembly protein subunit 16